MGVSEAELWGLAQAAMYNRADNYIPLAELSDALADASPEVRKKMLAELIGLARVGMGQKRGLEMLLRRDGRSYRTRTMISSPSFRRDYTATQLIDEATYNLIRAVEPGHWYAFRLREVEDHLHLFGSMTNPEDRIMLDIDVVPLEPGATFRR